MFAYIVTGTTHGIGQALAKAIVSQGDQLLSLSRAPDRADREWVNLQCDLSQPDDLVMCFERLLPKIRHGSAKDIVLINNAGVLFPMGPIDELSDTSVQYHIHVNQVAPALLMSAFIRFTQDAVQRRRIINISSGAARSPYAGWSMYCATKAAVEMMTRCVAREQQEADNPVEVCAVSPGKVETRLQKMIRNARPGQFPSQPAFIQAKASGELAEPGDIAEMLLELDKSRQFKNGGIYDLRTAQREFGRLRIEDCDPG